MNKFLIARFLPALGATLLTLAPMVCSAQVYKCVENGSTTFQAEPCKSGGTLMHLDPGPSAQAIEAARMLAEKNKKSAADSSTEWRAKQKSTATSRQADCDGMNKRVASLQETGNQLYRDAVKDNGNTMILNRQATANQRQEGDARNLAQALGCQ